MFIGKVNSKSGDKYVDSKRDQVMWTIKEPKQNIMKKFDLGTDSC